MVLLANNLAAKPTFLPIILSQIIDNSLTIGFIVDFVDVSHNNVAATAVRCNPSAIQQNIA